MTSRLPWALCVALLGSACTEDVYVIGSLCGPIGACPGGSSNAGEAGAGTGGGSAGSAGADSAGSGGTSTPGFALDLTGSGVERLPQQLLGEEPTHLLVADDATLASWDARVGDGFDVVAPAALEVGQPSPFADPGSVLRHAGSATFSAPSTWADTSSGALALEVVFRSEPGATLLSQRDTDAGLELFLDLEGRLNLRLDAGADEIIASSQALVADAWHHCLALFDDEQAAAQVFCNGQAGVSIGVPAGFVVNPVEVPATLGGSDPARVHWAALARWQAITWGARTAWTDVARERFARLVGTYAEGSPDPLPFPEVRASGAYVDMTPSDAPELRRLHPVGEHWPRIVCRPTSDSARACGLLVETAGSQSGSAAAFVLDNWDALELSVSPAGASGPTGADTLFAVTPSAQNVEHTLELDAQFGAGPGVLSFFARSAGARRISAEVVGVASATFDLTELTVVESSGASVINAESWGNGLVRLSYSFDVDAGPGTLRLAILADDSAAVFAGDGGVAAYLGDVELRFRSFSTPLPMFGTIQQADHLVYPATGGNLPAGSWFEFSAEIWLPSAPLLADAAVFNANSGGLYDQQLNLYVSPQDSALRFWGLQGDDQHWNFSNPEPVTDGNLHQLAASVGPDGATLSVDGQTVTDDAGEFDLALLDQIEIGTSTSSSGPLTGMVRRIVITPAD